MSRLAHLTGRFIGSLWPLGPSRAAESWVAGVLQPGELALWRRMSRPDRRHAVAVAHRVEAVLAADAGPPVLAAALLHDVGKVVSGLGTMRRVLATVAGDATAGRHGLAWSNGRGFTRQVGLYLRHASLGADLLALAGSDPLTVAWAREHHLPADQWTVPAGVAQALKAADND